MLRYTFFVCSVLILSLGGAVQKRNQTQTRKVIWCFSYVVGVRSKMKGSGDFQSIPYRLFQNDWQLIRSIEGSNKFIFVLIR